MWIAFIIFYLGHVSSIPVDDVVRLEKISTVYLPYTYENSEPLYRYSSGTAEQCTYDSDNKIMYVVGSNIIHAIDIHDVKVPKIVYHQEFNDVDITDIDFCGSFLFVSMHNLNNKEDGMVSIFKSFSSSEPMRIIQNITVGSHPDMLVSTKNCKTILVAIEGEPYEDNGLFHDPKGGVGVIKIGDSIEYSFINFTKFDNSWSQLESRGLRFVYRQNGNLFSNDVEPEYITFNKDETKAYICLQENNAVAVLDMKTEQIEEILPLGYKSWENSGFDASNRDGGINIRPWPVFGIYQPDAIQTMEFAGNSYLVTANEGDSKQYGHRSGVIETVRVKDIVLAENSTVLVWADTQNMSSTIQTDSNLGRLEITNYEGKDSSGSYNSLYTFGTRSFAIWNLTTMDLIYDSGSDIEDYHQKYFNRFFNTNGAKTKETIAQTFDSRSDDKGPECESVKVATIGEMIVLFIGSERPGSIIIYKIKDKITHPEFQSIWMGIEEVENATWEELYNRRKISEIDPEDIRYVSPANSPTGSHMLISTGTVSGTVSFFNVKGLPDSIDVKSGVKTVAPAKICILLTCIIACWLKNRCYWFNFV